jgi:hypothetical protein
MRYIVIFSDRTSKRVSEEQARIFIQAMKSRQPVEYKGSVYAGYSIVAVKPLHAHEQEQREEAAEAGLYRCPYGKVHPNKADCVCKDAGFRRILEAEEERFLLEEGSNRPSAPASIDFADAKTLGFTDAKLLYEAPSWTKAGSVRKPRET